MKRVLLLICVLLLAALAFAQDEPKAQVFGGYSYLRLNPGFGLSSQSMNGWNAALTGNFGKYLGITADFAGHYASPSVSFADLGITGLPVGTVGLDLSSYTFLFGPQIKYPAGKITPFGHVLFGAGRAKASIGGNVAGINLGSLIGASQTDTAWAMAGGGGVDYNVGSHFALRVAQIDWLRTNYFSNSQNNFRYSGGIVLKLGGR